MGAGVSLSFPRKGIPGVGILLLLASVPLTRDHVSDWSKLLEFASADLLVDSSHSAVLHGSSLIFGPQLFVGYQRTGLLSSHKGEAVGGGFIHSRFRNTAFNGYPKKGSDQAHVADAGSVVHFAFVQTISADGKIIPNPYTVQIWPFPWFYTFLPLHVQTLFRLSEKGLAHAKPTASYGSSGQRMTGSEPGSLDPLDGGYGGLLLGFQNSTGDAEAGSGARDSKFGLSDITIFVTAGDADKGGAAAIDVDGGTVSGLGSMPRVCVDGVGSSGTTRRRRKPQMQQTVGEGRPAYSLIDLGFEEMDFLVFRVELVFAYRARLDPVGCKLMGFVVTISWVSDPDSHAKSASTPMTEMLAKSGGLNLDSLIGDMASVSSTFRIADILTILTPVAEIPGHSEGLYSDEQGIDPNPVLWWVKAMVAVYKASAPVTSIMDGIALGWSATACGRDVDGCGFSG